MFLLKIVNKSFFSLNTITNNYMKHSFYNIKTLKFIEKEIFSFYTR